MVVCGGDHTQHNWMLYTGAGGGANEDKISIPISL